MGNKGIIISFLCSIAVAIYVCLVNNIGGLTFVVLCMLIMCALFSYYNGMKTYMKPLEKKYKGYTPKEKSVYYDSRLKTLKEKVNSKEISEFEYKKERDRLTKEFNEGEIYDRNES